MSHPSLPSTALLRQQAEWLAPARSRLLRRAGIARCRRVLDLGCGVGAVTAELARRTSGFVVALDRDRGSLLLTKPSRDREGAVEPATNALGKAEGDSPVFRSTYDEQATSTGRKTGPSPDVVHSLLAVQADAARLPFAAESFDLVFCQFTLMWLDAPAAIGEIHRVLVPDGRLVAIEPDYEGLLEYPAPIATREIWLAALARAGADPSLGRKLPGLLAESGFSARVDLLDHLAEPSPARFDFLAELPLSPAERHALAAVRTADSHLASSGGSRVAHLPVFLATAVKTPSNRFTQEVPP